MLDDEARFREAHFDFLTIELKLAATFIQTADVERGLDGEAEAQALERAREALDTVTRLIQPHRLTTEQVSVILNQRDDLEQSTQERVLPCLPLIGALEIPG